MTWIDAGRIVAVSFGGVVAAFVVVVLVGSFVQWFRDHRPAVRFADAAEAHRMAVQRIDRELVEIRRDTALALEHLKHALKRRGGKRG